MRVIEKEGERESETDVVLRKFKGRTIFPSQRFNSFGKTKKNIS